MTQYTPYKEGEGEEQAFLFLFFSYWVTLVVPHGKIKLVVMVLLRAVKKYS